MKAKGDIAYCTSKTCKCDKHESNYEFEEDKLYWFMERCEEEKDDR